MTIRRVLRMYEKDGEKVVGEYELQGVNVAVLRQLFGESADNPMYDCYPVAGSQAEYFENIIKERIDAQLYDYFVECDASD